MTDEKKWINEEKGVKDDKEAWRRRETAEKEMELWSLLFILLSHYAENNDRVEENHILNIDAEPQNTCVIKLTLSYSLSCPIVPDLVSPVKSMIATTAS